MHTLLGREPAFQQLQASGVADKLGCLVQYSWCALWDQDSSQKPFS